MDECKPLVDGIVAEGGLSSCVEIAQKIFSFLPIGLLMKDKWQGLTLVHFSAQLEPCLHAKTRYTP